MKFWDSSAVVPLVVPEAVSPVSRRAFEEDAEIVVWALTVTEVYSALHRKQRDGRLTEPDLLLARERLERLRLIWSEVTALERARQRAHRLLAVHPLRAADALQLAAALITFDDRPEGEAFITFDDTLATAARREGFQVIAG